MNDLLKAVIIFLVLISLITATGYYLLGLRLPNFYEMITIYFICELGVKQDNLKKHINYNEVF